MENKKILVTGGGGFIGSHIAKRIVEKGNNVVIIDNFLTGKRENVPKEAELIELDISKKEELDKLPKNFDAVLHLAAQSSGEISNEKPEMDLFVNSLGTLNLLRWAVKNNIKRFEYASSMGVYGNADKLPITEEEKTDPISFYGISKLAAEGYVKHFSDRLNTTIFRMFNVYGPGQNLENMKQGMVSIFLTYMLRNEEIWVKGSKDRFRDFIYIDDIVDVWISAIDNEKTFGKIYNLAAGTKTHVWELVEGLKQAFGADNNYPVKYEGSTPADQFGVYADVSKIKNDLNWKPKFGLKEGLKILVEEEKKKWKEQK